jgi:hypothetical protein
MEKRHAYLRKWESRSSNDRPMLHPTDGLDLGTQAVENAESWNTGQAAPAEGSGRNVRTAERLRELEALKRDGLVTDAEYQEQRRRLLNDL